MVSDTMGRDASTSLAAIRASADRFCSSGRGECIIEDSTIIRSSSGSGHNLMSALADEKNNDSKAAINGIRYCRITQIRMNGFKAKF